MKKILGSIVLAAVLMAGCTVYAPRGETAPPAPPPPPAPYDQSYASEPGPDYYTYLSPYGLWVSYSPYGYVWVPRNIDSYWRPYYRGHWVWTDDGWTWISSERWGWLVYHYGRWGFEPRLGWYWVPGTLWGPAWVAWRWGDLYIGWAPLPPGADFIPGRGFANRNFVIPGHYWNFVHGRNFMDASLDRWIVPRDRNVTIINVTTYNVNVHVRNNRVYDDGVGLDRVRRMTNQTIERHALRDAREPGEARVEGRDILLYKPALRKAPGAGPRDAVDQDQAVKRLGREPGPPVSEPVAPPRVVSSAQSQARERQALENRQQTEIRQAQRDAETQRRTARTQEARRKVDESLNKRLTELKKKHAEERAKLAEKQKAEDKKNAKPPVKKKVPEKH